ncbi:MAG: glycoside hydrolase family 2 TIM barrel-domain containing protein [Calditrichaceae bacterium]
MKIIIRSYFLFFVLILLLNQKFLHANDSIREEIQIDNEWKFALGHATDPEKDFGFSTAYFTYYAKAGYGDGPASANFDDRAWRVLDLPHDWCVELPFSPSGGHSHGYKMIGHNFPENSVGWYRKRIYIPQSDLGKKISIRFDGIFRNSKVWVNGFYLGLEESGYASFSYDITDYLNYEGNNVIAVRVDASVEEGWFYEGAGIYRHVWLLKTNPLHVAEYGTFVTSNLKDDIAAITIRTEVKNDLKTTIKSNDNIIDAYQTKFGVRTVKFDPDSGFFLNGNHVKILGTNNHQDHAGVGTAIPDALQDFRVKRLKAMGSNAIRTSHNPPTPELLDACDRLGMLVLDENRLMGSSKAQLDDLEQLIKRDRNHPSVILWSLGNEEWAIEGNVKGVRITETMQKFAQMLDTSRAFTVASSGGWNTGIGTVSEVMGSNYISHGDVDAHHKKFPWQPAVGTEETTASGTRGTYITDIKNAYQAPRNFVSEAGGIERGWKFYAARPFLSGLFYWTGFDYRGEPNPYGWPQVTSQYGILDLCGFPKDHFYYLKSWWSDKPVLYITPHWNWKDRAGEAIDVTINTNLDEIELFLNDKNLGKKQVEKNSRTHWKVNYEPGVLLAKGFKNGNQTLQAKQVTTGIAAKIELSADRDKIQADGQDISVITIKVKDKEGRVIPDAGNMIKFSLNGPGKILGVGNGNPSSHEPDKYLQTIKVSSISDLKELTVDRLTQRPEVSANYDDSNWIAAFSDEPDDWHEYRDSLIVLRGSFELPEVTSDCIINLFTRSIVENQSVYINGKLIKANIVRDDLKQSFELKHDIIHQGINVYAVTGKRFRLRNRWDEPNRDPGRVQVIYPAGQWKRRVFNGLAQIIIQSQKEPGQILLTAESAGLKNAKIIIASKNYDR